MPELIAIHPNGKIIREEITEIPKLKKLNDIVGGYIETVPYFTTFGDRPCVAFCNEEGKLHGLDYNRTATTLWHCVSGYRGDVLVGSIAIVVGSKEFLANM